MENQLKMDPRKSPSTLSEVRKRSSQNVEIHWVDEIAVMNDDGRGLLKKTTEHMDMVKSSPERVKAYFLNKNVAYAEDSQ